MIEFTTKVRCDECYDYVEVDDDIDNAIWQLENDGWLLNSNRYAVGLDLCPECKRRMEEQEAGI